MRQPAGTSTSHADSRVGRLCHVVENHVLRPACSTSWPYSADLVQMARGKQQIPCHAVIADHLSGPACFLPCCFPSAATHANRRRRLSYSATSVMASGHWPHPSLSPPIHTYSGAGRHAAFANRRRQVRGTSCASLRARLGCPVSITRAKSTTIFRASRPSPSGSAWRGGPRPRARGPEYRRQGQDKKRELRPLTCWAANAASRNPAGSIFGNKRRSWRPLPSPPGGKRGGHASTMGCHATHERRASASFQLASEG